jgi:hypothetical protein
MAHLSSPGTWRKTRKIDFFVSSHFVLQILSFVLLPITGALAWYFKFVHKNQPKPTKSYLLTAGKHLIRLSTDKDLSWVRFWTTGPATLVSFVFFLFHWVMMLIVGFNFFLYSILSFGLPFCPEAGFWRSCCSCCHKGAFFVVRIPSPRNPTKPNLTDLTPPNDRRPGGFWSCRFSDLFNLHYGIYQE